MTFVSVFLIFFFLFVFFVDKALSILSDIYSFTFLVPMEAFVARKGFLLVGH